MSLRLRLALFGTAVVALTLVLFGALFYGLLARGATTNQDDALRGRAREAVNSLNAISDFPPRAPVAPADLRTSNEIFIEVFDSNWTVVYSTAQLNGSPPAPSARLHATAPEVLGGFFDTDSGFRYFGLTFKGGFVVAGQSTRVVQSSLSGVLGFLVISGVPTLIAALAASWLVAGRALKPLKDVAGAAHRLERFITTFGPDASAVRKLALLQGRLNNGSRALELFNMARRLDLHHR